MQEFKVYAPAKLNLYLDVVGKRPDGNHNIETLFEKIDLKDEIVIKESKEGIKVDVFNSSCPSGEKNIVYKALVALLNEADIKLGLEVSINKKIPVSAGLGGGSSDAASALRSVNDKFKLGVPKARLLDIAKGLGKDVPFFMIDEPFAIGTECGDELKIIDSDISLAHVVIKPDTSISTALAYSRVDLGKRQKIDKGINKLITALKSKDISSIEKNCYNIFEEALGEDKDNIESIKGQASRDTKKEFFLSGSGPAIFCIIEGRDMAKAILGNVQKINNMEYFLATTYKGGIYGDN
ncbi:MAG: 4-(cytidine 5'-diphospho)-2-C-methyl-D-erythritol kinase [Candidatus Omnitrophota bacterium]